MSEEQDEKISGFMLFESKISIAQLVVLLVSLAGIIGTYVTSQQSMAVMNNNVAHLVKEVDSMKAIMGNRFTSQDGNAMKEYFNLRFIAMDRRIDKLEERTR